MINVRRCIQLKVDTAGALDIIAVMKVSMAQWAEQEADVCLD